MEGCMSWRTSTKTEQGRAGGVDDPALGMPWAGSRQSASRCQQQALTPRDRVHCMQHHHLLHCKGQQLLHDGQGLDLCPGLGILDSGRAVDRVSCCLAVLPQQPCTHWGPAKCMLVLVVTHSHEDRRQQRELISSSRSEWAESLQAPGCLGSVAEPAMGLSQAPKTGKKTHHKEFDYNRVQTNRQKGLTESQLARYCFNMSL